MERHDMFRLKSVGLHRLCLLVLPSSDSPGSPPLLTAHLRPSSSTLAPSTIRDCENHK